MATDKLHSNALITTEFQLAGTGSKLPAEVFIVRDGFRNEVRMGTKRHGAEPSVMHQVEMDFYELIAFGKLCIALGRLFLGNA